MGLPIGTIVLIIVAILVFFGVLHRVLDRMRLSDRGALTIILLMAAGTFVDIPISRGAVPVSINVGGALVPLGVAIWLTVTAEDGADRLRAILAPLVTGGVIWGLSKVLNPEEQFMTVPPMIIFGLAAGIIAALAGRSRRAAFVGGVGGIVVADIIHWIELLSSGIPGSVSFGGAGTFDATVIAGILAVGLVELVGEAREHVVKQGVNESEGGPRQDSREGTREGKGDREDDTE
ncbi:MAG: DUF1614 domain-containing protein [Bacillota bacterium]